MEWIQLIEIFNGTVTRLKLSLGIGSWIQAFCYDSDTNLNPSLKRSHRKLPSPLRDPFHFTSESRFPTLIWANSKFVAVRAKNKTASISSSDIGHPNMNRSQSLLSELPRSKSKFESELWQNPPDLSSLFDIYGLDTVLDEQYR
jgi:hypothetical protein